MKIPLLGEIPIIGPIFFDSTIFLYITYALIIVIQVGLFRTRWGLRVRAVGEHPTAADTVGIRVLWTRYRNVVLGGHGGRDRRRVPDDRLGRLLQEGHQLRLRLHRAGRDDLRSVDAARLGCRCLLFGVADSLAIVLSSLNVPISSNFLLMTPYVATIVAVVGWSARYGRPPLTENRTSRHSRRMNQVNLLAVVTPARGNSFAVTR